RLGQPVRHNNGELAHPRNVHADRGRAARAWTQSGNFGRQATAMNPNPLSDVIAFVTNPVGTTAIFWLLVVASVVIAAVVWNRLPEQRTLSNLVRLLIRFVMGAFWWQQSLWKLPPLYTDHPEAAFGETGLAYWMGLMGKHAAIPLQADFVTNIVLPHFYLFAPIVYSLEVLTGV